MKLKFSKNKYREAIKENEDGFLDIAFAEAIQNAKRQQLKKRTERIKLGMMRHVYLIIDFSESMSSQDLKPNRLLCTLKVIKLLNIRKISTIFVTLF